MVYHLPEALVLHQFIFGNNDYYAEMFAYCASIIQNLSRSNYNTEGSQSMLD